MRKKPVIGLLTSILSLAALSPVVFAAPAGSPFAGILDMVRGIFEPFFRGMPDDVTLKILIGFLIFPFVGYLLSLVFKQKPKLGWIVGGVLTLITTIVIPGQLIRGIAYEYATVFMFVLAALPIVGLFLLMQGIKKLFRPEEHPVLYHLTCAAIVLLIIIILNHLIGAFSSSSQFSQNLQYANIQKFPGFALGVLTIMLLYHLLAPLFKWGFPHARERFGGGGGGLPQIPAVPRGGAGSAQQALGGEERQVTQEIQTEARAAEEAEQQARLAEERQRLAQELAGLDLRNLQDAQKIMNDLNELVRLTQVYKDNPQALQQIAQHLNNIKPAEADLQANLTQLRQRMVELERAGQAADRMILSEAQVTQWFKGVIEKENINGIRNLFAQSAMPELQHLGITMDQVRQKKDEFLRQILTIHQQIVAVQKDSYQRNFDLLRGNIGLIEASQTRFLASLQAFVTALQQTAAGQDKYQDALRAIQDAQTVFGQLSAALTKNQDYERDIQAALQYQSQLDRLEASLCENLVRLNQQLLEALERARQQSGRAALPPPVIRGLSP